MGSLLSGAVDVPPQSLPRRLPDPPMIHPSPRSHCRALVVVAGGGRDPDWSPLSIAAALRAAAGGRLVQLLLHGGARGADRAIEAAAHRLGWPVEAMPAQWARYGLAAGPVRNGQMVRNASEEAAAYRCNGPTSSRGGLPRPRRHWHPTCSRPIASRGVCRSPSKSSIWRSEAGTAGGQRPQSPPAARLQCLSPPRCRNPPPGSPG
jgi:hypothetical protein